MNMHKVNQRKWFKKWWGILIIILLLLLLIIIFLFGIFFFRTYNNILKGVSNVQIKENKQNVTAEEEEEYDLSKVNKQIISIVNSEDDPSTGPDQAEIVIVEFFDFQCTYCKEVHNSVRRLSVEYEDSVKFIFRDFPLLGEMSDFLALAGECAHEQNKFFAFFDKVYSYEQEIDKFEVPYIADIVGMDVRKFIDCIDTEKYLSELEKDKLDASKAGVQATPVFFINGHKISGAIPYSVLKKIIDTSLNSLNNN